MLPKVSTPTLKMIKRTRACFCGSGKRFKECCGSFSIDRSAPDGIMVIQNAMPDSVCNSSLELISGASLKPHNSNPAESRTDATTANWVQMAVSSIEVPTHLLDLDKKFDHYCRKNIESHYMKSIATVETPTLLFYPPGGGYGTHADSELYNPASDSWERTKSRDLSVYLYLNDDFTGGEIEFPNFHFSHKPRQGDLIAFPSDHRYMHSVSAVESGTRCVMASWLRWAI